MTLQEWISIWQAQPFRAFYLHAPRGRFPVLYPASAALTDDMQIALVADDSHVETFRLEEIERCESFGPAMTLAEAMAAISPEVLAQHVQLISAATAAASTAEPHSHPAADPGNVSLRAAKGDNGVDIVRVSVETREGRPMLSTAGTRWNLHGVEPFENGTSLYLHHLDHPTVEQRIILWPPEMGTFDTFAEQMPSATLQEELKRRDRSLTEKPAKPEEPPAECFRNTLREWVLQEPDGWEAAFGPNHPAMDPARYEFILVPRILESGRAIGNPCLTDMMREEILFNLVDTDWDAAGERENRIWHVRLRHPGYPGHRLTLHIDLDRVGATVDDDTTLRPLGWIERHLLNFALYEGWDAMFDALAAGPVKSREPDLTIPLAGGFHAELWAGDHRFPAPFLQSRIVDAQGQTVFDLRATAWSAAVHAHADEPAITLTFLSSGWERDASTARYPLEIDLVTHRVTCRYLAGSSTIGMIQAMVRQVRGAAWMIEALQQWFAKGASVDKRL